MRTFSSRLFDFDAGTQQYSADMSTLDHGGRHPGVFQYDEACDAGFLFHVRGSEPRKFIIQEIDEVEGDSAGWLLIPADEVKEFMSGEGVSVTIFVQND